CTYLLFFFSSRRRHTRSKRDWSSDVCSSDLTATGITKDINLGLDLQGGFEVLYEVEPIDEEQKVTRDLLEGTVQTSNDRVNRLRSEERRVGKEWKSREWADE